MNEELIPPTQEEQTGGVMQPSQENPELVTKALSDSEVEEWILHTKKIQEKQNYGSNIVTWRTEEIDNRKVFHYTSTEHFYVDDDGSLVKFWSDYNTNSITRLHESVLNTASDYTAWKPNND